MADLTKVRAVEAPGEGRSSRRHRYLQSLVMTLGEVSGYRVVIARLRPDGPEQVHVSLEQDDERVAFLDSEGLVQRPSPK